MSDPFGIADILGNPEKQRELEAENKRLRDLVGDYGARIRRVLELCGDPAQADRTITRREVQRLLRGEQP